MKRYAILFVMLLAVAAVAASADDEQGIPEPSGSYAVSVHGSFALCLNPSENFAAGACGASGVTAYPVSFEEVGTITYASGIGCESVYQVLAALPSSPAYTAPNIVSPNAHTVVKITSYDAATGVGTASFTGYTGGSCNGASFDSSGAIETATGTLQIVVTEGGKRNEVLVTQNTGVPVSDLASVQLSGTDLKQTPERGPES
ncbi:MAG: hypothetical protein JO249_12580 [Acidobacteria bacterium]|nr:hypothetical protein [Acidobacteriota bacterium]